MRVLILISVLFGSPQWAIAQIPAVYPGGIVNAASFDGPSSLTPGMIFSIFGENLTDGTIASAGSVPLPTSLGGVTISASGVPVPLFYVSPTQINAQAPVELAGLSATNLVVGVEIGFSRTDTLINDIEVKPVSPGIFTWDQGGPVPAPSCVVTSPLTRSVLRVVSTARPIPLWPVKPSRYSSPVSELSPVSGPRVRPPPVLRLRSPSPRLPSRVSSPV